jgi:cell wall-associated NlpC family hydrolase
MSKRLAATLLVLATPAALSAQELNVSAGRWLVSSHVSEYRLGIGGMGMGPVRLRYSAQFLNQAGTSQAHWYGAGADLILRPIATAQPYFIVGAAVGAGRGSLGGGEEPGVGWWGGVGAELFAWRGIGMQAEAQYTRRTGVGLSGVMIAVKLGSRYGSAVAEAAPAPLNLPRANPDDEEAIRLATAARASRAPAAAIVGTALTVMGTPYRWGGTGPEGFDCSGLIQYAYTQHGITLARRSVDQAQAGTEVARELAALEPGDILTFSSEPGGGVQHVGLYVGEGRFIHSARGGVQISELSAADPIGKWWFDRWSGARRIL